MLVWLTAAVSYTISQDFGISDNGAKELGHPGGVAFVQLLEIKLRPLNQTAVRIVTIGWHMGASYE